MTGDEPPSDSLDAGRLLETLARHEVDFVVVGGLAGLAHGSSYPTFDLDVAYSREAVNLERMARALANLGVKLTNAPADLPFQVDERTLANGSNFTFETPAGRLDILGNVPGLKSYDELRTGAIRAEIEGIPVRIASIDHLIAMKRAANRTKDRLMLEEYIAIADEQQRAGGS